MGSSASKGREGPRLDIKIFRQTVRCAFAHEIHNCIIPSVSAACLDEADHLLMLLSNLGGCECLDVNPPLGTG